MQGQLGAGCLVLWQGLREHAALPASADDALALLAGWTRQRGTHEAAFDSSTSGICCPPAQIVVNGLPWAWTWKELKDLMAGAGGNIVRADVVYGRDGRRCAHAAAAAALASSSTHAI